MWARETLNRMIAEKGLAGKCWGRRGPGPLAELEEQLGVQFDRSLREFVLNVGNMRVDPFSVVVAGDENASITAATETRRLQGGRKVHLPKHCLKIMDHAGEAYIYDTSAQKVLSYDALNVAQGAETQTWQNLGEFITWLLDEASEQLTDDRFKF